MADKTPDDRPVKTTFGEFKKCCGSNPDLAAVFANHERLGTHDNQVLYVPCCLMHGGGAAKPKPAAS